MPATTTFISKAKNFQVTLETEGIPMRDEHGSVVDKTRGKRAVFINGLYQATPEEAAAMRKAFTYNAEFFELGNEPGRENPSLDEQLERAAVAAVDRDEKKLVAILEEEQATYQRDPVLKAVKLALGRLGNIEVGRRPPGRPKQIEPEAPQPETASE